MYNIFLIIGLIIALFILFLLVLWVWGNIRSKVPFIGVPLETLKEIENTLSLKKDSIVYDLGCGDGRVLFYLHKNNPTAKYIGIECNLFPYILAIVRNYFYKKKNKDDIKIIKGDFFDFDLSNSTHIFTYLYPNIMDDLLPKFDKELKKGTILVSASFHFTLKKENKEIDLRRKKYQLAKKIYLYEF